MMSTPPFIRTDWQKLTADEKFVLIKRAIEGSKEGLLFPVSPKEYTDFIVGQFGEKSYTKLISGSRLCSVQLDEENNTYTISPNKRVRNGYEGLDGDETIPSNVTASQFITVFDRVLDKCF